MSTSTPEVHSISASSTVSCRFLPEDRAIEAGGWHDDPRRRPRQRHSRRNGVRRARAPAAPAACWCATPRSPSPRRTTSAAWRSRNSPAVGAWPASIRWTRARSTRIRWGFARCGWWKAPAWGGLALIPNIQKIYVKPSPPTLHDPRADWSLVQDELAAAAGDLDPTRDALSRLGAIGEDISQGVTVVIAGNRVISVERGDTTGTAYGLAFEIGTTTVVGALMDLTTGPGGRRGVGHQRPAHLRRRRDQPHERHHARPRVRRALAASGDPGHRARHHHALPGGRRRAAGPRL